MYINVLLLPIGHLNEIRYEIVAEIRFKHSHANRDIEYELLQIVREIRVVAESNGIFFSCNDNLVSTVQTFVFRLNLGKIRLGEIMMIREMKDSFFEWEFPEMIDERTGIRHACQKHHRIILVELLQQDFIWTYIRKHRDQAAIVEGREIQFLIWHQPETF